MRRHCHRNLHNKYRNVVTQWHGNELTVSYLRVQIAAL